jgi:hypothetical protein
LKLYYIHIDFPIGSNKVPYISKENSVEYWYLSLIEQYADQRIQKHERSKNLTNKVRGANIEQSRGRWMAPGIGIGAALGIFFGNYILGPALGSQSTGSIIGMSMGAGVGLVLGLIIGSGQNRELNGKRDTFEREKENSEK